MIIKLLTALLISFIFQALANKKTKYFGGDSITMIDYLIWPWFERAEMMGVKQYVLFIIINIIIN